MDPDQKPIDSAQPHQEPPQNFSNGDFDFAELDQRPERPSPLRKHWYQRWKIMLPTVLGVIVVAVGGFAWRTYSLASNTIGDGSSTGLFGQIERIVNEDVEPLRGQERDRINVLLLGKGGSDHPGGDLTDTLMVASIKPSTNQVALLSLPRDMVVPIYPEGSTIPEYRKINYAVYLQNIDEAKQLFEDVTGQPVDYYLEVDFTGFRDVVDALGGIDVPVANSFTDYQYPDYNYGYQTIQFSAGNSHMDGETALQYARSRHGNNGEGSDFARSRRQQIILTAVRDTALSASTFLNPAKITNIVQSLGDHISSDIELWEMSRFMDFAKAFDSEQIINQVVDNSPSGLLYSEISSETGAYVLITNAGLGDYSEIQALADNIFDTTAQEAVVAVSGENAVVSVQNGTTIEGLAAGTAEELRSIGMTVNGIANAVVRDNATTLVYDLSGGQKPETGAKLAEEFGVEVRTAVLPTELGSNVRLSNELNPNIVSLVDVPAGVDFVVVLGTDVGSATAGIVTTTDEAQNF